MKRLLLLALLAQAAWAAPIHDAVRAGQPARVTELATASPGALGALDEQGLTPLVLAVQLDSLEVVEALLQAGADVNLGTPQNWTALHEAASNGRPEMVERLLRAGAKVDVRERQNSGTPLHIACFHGNTAVARLLLRAGANLNLRDREGLTPLWHARDQGHLELVKLLKQAGAR